MKCSSKQLDHVVHLGGPFLIAFASNQGKLDRVEPGRQMDKALNDAVFKRWTPFNLLQADSPSVTP